MRADVSGEAYLFLMTVITGVMCGMLYDLYYVIFSKAKQKLLVSLGDVGLVLSIGGAVMLSFYIFNSFELRWFMFLGMILGNFIYFLLLENVFVWILRKILKIFQFIFKILLTPGRFLYKILLVYIFMPILKLIKKFTVIFKSKETHSIKQR